MATRTRSPGRGIPAASTASATIRSTLRRRSDGHRGAHRLAVQRMGDRHQSVLLPRRPPRSSPASSRRSSASRSTSPVTSSRSMRSATASTSSADRAASSSAVRRAPISSTSRGGTRVEPCRRQLPRSSWSAPLADGLQDELPQVQHVAAARLPQAATPRPRRRGHRARRRAGRRSRRATVRRARSGRPGRSSRGWRWRRVPARPSAPSPPSGTPPRRRPDGRVSPSRRRGAGRRRRRGGAEDRHRPPTALAWRGRASPPTTSRPTTSGEQRDHRAERDRRRRARPDDRADRPAALRCPCSHLAEQPRLPDTGGAADDHGDRWLAVEPFEDRGQLGCSADERPRVHARSLTVRRRAGSGQAAVAISDGAIGAAISPPRRLMNGRNSICSAVPIMMTMSSVSDQFST